MKKQTKTPRQDCANWSTGTCSGIMLKDDGRQYIDRELANKPCRIDCGESCDYWAECVAP